MRLFFLLLLISHLQSSVPSEKTNQFTKELNAKPFVPKTTMDGRPANSVIKSQNTPEITKNNFTTINALQNMQQRLQKLQDVRLPKFQPKRQLHPNDKDENIPILRQLLHALGYLGKATDSPFYDLELETAVKAFQTNHCLDADGVIGDETQIRLNWSYATRLQMIGESIGKLQSLVFTDRTAIVNIPTYTLYAFADQKLKMRMKIIVGTAKRQTPTITSYVDFVEFNPVWIVPPTILFEDKIPKIVEDIEFLASNDLEVFDANGNEIEPTSVDWDEAESHNFPYSLHQKPSAKNALGCLRFNLINNQYIYLHDTPLKKLFKKSSRALSSGCIRLEKPKQLAKWLLNKDLDEINEAIDEGSTTVEKLATNMTVHITYLPVWVEEDGQVLWGDDPYKLQTYPQT